MQSQKHMAKRVGILALITAGVLLVPFIAMQLSDEVVWTSEDFIVVGILVFGFGLIYLLTMKNISSTKNRLIAKIILLGMFIFVWAELAVGIFGSPFAGS